MSWFRTTAALAASAALLLTPQVLPASAAPAGRTVEAVAPSKVVGPAKVIDGVVVDQFGNPVDDVDVYAARPNGTRVASSLTYASVGEDGPQHGYFYLSLDDAGRGTYVVTISKSGYRTVDAGRHQINRDKQVIHLGEIEIEKVRPATETSVAATRKVVTVRDRVSVKVTVRSKATRQPTGAVEVREGRTVLGTATLTAKNRGSVLVSLGRLTKGRHALQAFFLGSDELAPSSTKRPLTLVVTKPRK